MRQTAKKDYIFPDGFQFSAKTPRGYEDIGMVQGGATGVLDYDVYRLDAGNYKGAEVRTENQRFTLNPSPIWTWTRRNFVNLFSGIAKLVNGEVVIKGENIEASGIGLRLRHYDADLKVKGATVATLTSGTNADFIKINKPAGLLDWEDDTIQAVVGIKGWTEVLESEADNADLAGNAYFLTEDTLVLIVEQGKYASEADAETGIEDITIQFYKSFDWEFEVANATINAGASFNLKGVMEDGVNEFTASFTAEAEEGVDLLRLKVVS